LHCTGRGTDGQPPIPGATVADSAGGGLHAVVAILAALVARETTGQGTYLDVAVADGVLALMALQVDEYLATGAEPGPGHGLLTGRYACYDTYQARDGGWLSVAAIEGRFWANLCRELGVEQWAAHQHDDDRQDEIRADLRAAFATRDRDDWVAQLAPADTCVAPVLTVDEVVTDEHFAARRSFATACHPQQGEFRQVDATLAGTARATAARTVPDISATDTDAALAAAGFAPAEIDSLRTAGVVA
jgi:alpha-methylacyl-CoA racemase